MSSILEKTKNLPDLPGVYFFLGARKKILYIGKATSIRGRVRSYFNKDIIESRGPLIEKMLLETRSVGHIKTDSVLEALILEANLIKKHQPPYNTKEKSDKSFNYVVITDEDFPRILILRGKEILQNKISNHKSKILNLKSVYGPFPQGSILKEALKIVRKIFPFRDTCIPLRHSNILQNIRMLRKGKRPCFNRQIGLCPGVCTGEISKKEYRDTVRNIVLLFNGKKNALVKKLKKEMNAAANAQKFEKAAALKRQVFALSHIRDVSLIKKEYRAPFHGSSAFVPRPSASFRMEAYDVAHTSGTHVVGAMTVVENGEPQKNEYRKFNIQNRRRGSDTHALAEILERRLAHNEWTLPKLIIVDGGVAQKNTAERILKKYEISIPVVGVVKDEHHRPKRIIGRKDIIDLYEREILMANNEAHRFAIGFHREKRKTTF